uniref:Transmembrane protein n=1 Tax=Pseudo-nitzschia australis TaxID=44445 RepID=A0A7S4AKG1_9STRA|mmetsp:Transcript_16019/g.32848  ORF Transcript_16019/g.32848 Transcript_16019/m.32848 type:complete len:193 (+) Transcript_16019:429-1007(+)|eukprot:CAMPEP_0168183154 /NCGR_PEP_ID=MMETSP0139_2-20121125/12337_1 /TAXON_ID=44445 /ORGANISM="Pseudo-nitzschia australis, Strain 10249 10 AB" /LENGTH=192 /DNA_ID=CAMNT_0008104255 /DNA_START=600 /DNA_END=1178 /DNA_ORIENTATION=-
MADSSSATTNTSSERDPLMQQQQQQQHRHAMEYTREWNENERDSSEPNGNDAAASAVAGLIQQHTKKTPMTTTMMPTEEDFGCERARNECYVFRRLFYFAVGYAAGIVVCDIYLQFHQPTTTTSPSNTNGTARHDDGSEDEDGSTPPLSNYGRPLVLATISTFTVVFALVVGFDLFVSRRLRKKNHRKQSQG